MAQVDCARAYDSNFHVTMMRRSGVPNSLAFVYIRESRRAKMSFDHAGWSTMPASAGSRQGCSVAPMLFPLDFGGLHVGTTRGMGRCWPWDLPRHHDGVACGLGRRHLPLNATQEGLETMLTGLIGLAWRQTGLLIRWENVVVRLDNRAFSGRPTACVHTEVGRDGVSPHRRMPQGVGQRCTDRPPVAGDPAKELDGFPHEAKHLANTRTSCIEAPHAQLVGVSSFDFVLRHTALGEERTRRGQDDAAANVQEGPQPLACGWRRDPGRLERPGVRRSR